MRARASRHAAVSIAILAGTACSDPAPPEPEVATIELSVADTGTTIRFRDPLIVRAMPQGALGVPLARAVAWTSITPHLLSVQPLAADGDSARIQAVGVGTGQVRVSAGNIAQTFDVTVQDTVFSVTLTPGALSLVVGDTVSYTAAVEGPPNADRTVRWNLDINRLQTLPSLDPRVQRIQVRGAGMASLRATALADTTKTATVIVTGQPGKLAFVTQPSTTFPLIRFGVPIQVAVQDLSGVTSTRAASAITLSANSACGVSASGITTVEASNGVASFTEAGVSGRCASVTLAASSSPPALAAGSTTFSVVPRNCQTLIPLRVVDSVQALMEPVDCVALRGGQASYLHSYRLIVPDTTETAVIRVFAQSTAFTPRLESAIWADSALVHVDSLSTPGEALSAYALGPGTYRLNVRTTVPAAAGHYALTVGSFAGAPRGACLILTTIGVSFGARLACPSTFFALRNPLPGRRVLFHLPAGKEVTITVGRAGEGVNDTYLEVFDVTDGSALFIDADDNSGGGPDGTDSRIRLSSHPTARLIEARIGRVAGTNQDFRLTITP